MALLRPPVPRFPLVLAVLVLLFASVGAPLSVSAPALAQAPWLNTSNRQAVVNAYNTEFGRAAVPTGWQASGECDAGVTSREYRSSVLRRVNFFRSLAGVPANVVEDPTYTAKAQDAALMIARTGRVSHHPDASFTCLTGEATEAAASSNLFLGLHGVDAVAGYVRDEGISDASHRAVLFHPNSARMGTGDIPSTSATHAANALWAYDDNVLAPTVAVRESAGFVAWPPRGFVPSPLVFPSWSFMINGADFRGASVTMTSAQGPVSLTIDHRGSGAGAPFPTLVWTPTVSHGSGDTTYLVSITGVAVNGANRDYSYEVTVLDVNSTSTLGDEFRPFVSRAHVDFLARPPTALELDFWSRELASGLDRYSFVSELSSSDAWTASVVDRLYRDTLGRSPDGAGRTHWSGVLQQGTPVATVAAAFYGSDEYVTSKGTGFEPWVSDLYSVLLHRRVDAAGSAYWVDLAASDGSAVVAHRLYQSEESRRARVVALYQQFLGRNPDAAGLTYWANELRSGDDLALAANLAASTEYFLRSSN